MQNKPLLEYHARHGIAVEAYGRLAYIPSLSRSLSIPHPLPLFSHTLGQRQCTQTAQSMPQSTPPRHNTHPSCFCVSQSQALISVVLIDAGLAPIRQHVEEHLAIGDLRVSVRLFNE